MYTEYLKKHKTVRRCRKDGELGYKYGSDGECFVGKDAYKKAEKDQKNDTVSSAKDN